MSRIRGDGRDDGGEPWVLDPPVDGGSLTWDEWLASLGDERWDDVEPLPECPGHGDPIREPTGNRASPTDHESGEPREDELAALLWRARRDADLVNRAVERVRAARPEVRRRLRERFPYLMAQYVDPGGPWERLWRAIRDE